MPISLVINTFISGTGYFCEVIIINLNFLLHQAHAWNNYEYSGRCLDVDIWSRGVLG